MIADFARVALADGTTRPAIDLGPGWELLTVRNHRSVPTPVVERTIESHDDVVCLLLSNGQKLVGSRDQRIAVWRKQRNWFKQMAEIEPGMELHGEVAGLPTIVRVMGVMFNARQAVRMIGFTLANNDVFIVEGIVCR